MNKTKENLNWENYKQKTKPETRGDWGWESTEEEQQEWDTDEIQVRRRCSDKEQRQTHTNIHTWKQGNGTQEEDTADAN